MATVVTTMRGSNVFTGKNERKNLTHWLELVHIQSPCMPYMGSAQPCDCAVHYKEISDKTMENELLRANQLHIYTQYECNEKNRWHLIVQISLLLLVDTFLCAPNVVHIHRDIPPSHCERDGKKSFAPKEDWVCLCVKSLCVCMCIFQYHLKLLIFSTNHIKKPYIHKRTQTFGVPGRIAETMATIWIWIKHRFKLYSTRANTPYTPR